MISRHTNRITRDVVELSSSRWIFCRAQPGWFARNKPHQFTAFTLSASRAINSSYRHKHWHSARLETAIVAMHNRVAVQHQLRPRHWLQYVRLSPLQTKNSQMEVFHGALLRLLCSDRFKYEIPLNMYCFCKHCLCVFVYQSHVHNETTKQSWLSISPPKTWLN